jgi:hypothetical protein
VNVTPTPLYWPTIAVPSAKPSKSTVVPLNGGTGEGPGTKIPNGPTTANPAGATVLEPSTGFDAAKALTLARVRIRKKTDNRHRPPRSDNSDFAFMRILPINVN